MNDISPRAVSMGDGLKPLDEQARVVSAVKRHSGMVYRLAYARTRSRADADDVFQDVFMKLFARKIPFESEAHEKAWLIRTTCCVSINLAKSVWRRRTVPIADAPAQAPPDADEALAWALSALKPKARCAIHLFYYERMSAEEIGEAMGESAASVRARPSRARRKLKQLITEKEGCPHAESTVYKGV